MSQSGQFTSLSGAISTLTGDGGGAVSPTVGNIDIFGGTGIVVTGTPASSLLTIDVSGDIATSFISDTGTAVPVASDLNVIGGANIATTGAGNTLTIAVSGTTDHTVQVGNAAGSLTSIPIGTMGQVLVGSTGADPAFSEIGNNSGLTDHGVLLSQGNAAFVATSVGANGQLLIGGTGVDPAFALLTSSGSTVVFTAGSNTLNLETGAAVPVSFTTDSGSAVPAAGVLSVLGGTNINTGGATSIVTVNLDAAITVDSVGTSVSAANLTISGDTIQSAGSDANVDINFITQGTGEVTIGYATPNAVAIYSAAGGLDEVSLLTNGQLVIGSTGSAPVAASLTSTGSSLTITGGAGTLNIEIAAPVSVANGGTGATTLTDHSVLVGSGTAAITALTVGTIGQVLTGATTADPVFSAIGTNSSLTDHGILLGQGTAAFVAAAVGTTGQVMTGTTGSDPAFANIGVNSSLTDHGVLLGQGTSAFVAAAVGTNGQVLLGSTTADPVFATLASSGGTITFTPGAGTLNLESVPEITWSEVTGATQAMAVGNAYILNYATLLTATLPATAAVGDVMRIVGKGAGGWRLAQNAGQTMHIGTTATTTGAGGRLDSSAIQDSIEFVCITANTDFRVISSMGNITVT